MSEPRPEVTDPVVRALIKTKARQLTRNSAITDMDRDDLEQELALALLRKLPDYDPARGGVTAFTSVVLNSAAADLVRRAAVRCRLQRGESLAHRHSGGRLDPLIEDHERRLGISCVGGTDAVGLRIDVEEFVRLLPTEDAELAVLLKNGCISEVARQLGLPRSTVRDRVRRLLAKFESELFREKSPKSSAISPTACGLS